jgi:uncharacterized protein
MTILQGSLLFGSAMAAGMVNAVAGGGTLLTFPSLLWAGHPPIIANATSTVALVPGTWSSIWGYRKELETAPRHLFILMIPSLIGGIIGASLLKHTPPATFAALVPFLILFATILFLVQEHIQRWRQSSETTKHQVTTRWLVGTAFYQFLIAVYGGYFGAGIGILMLAALGFMGLSNIHQMNGLKNIFGSSINAVAAVYFIVVGLVNWPAALLMAAGSIIGGYGAAGLARRLGQKFVRRTVIVIGLAMTISLLIKQQ